MPKYKSLVGLLGVLLVTFSHYAEAVCSLSSLERLSDSPVTVKGGRPLSAFKIATDPSVLLDGNKYRMWFMSGDSAQRVGIGYAESVDGLTWSVFKKTSLPDPVIDLVLAPAPNGWNAPGIETPMVLRGPDGKLRMYFTGDRAPAGSHTFAIGLATSADGINWTPNPKPVLEARNSWEMPMCDGAQCFNGGVLEPSVLYDAKARLYKMWYAGVGTQTDSFLAIRIGYATSPDGVTWTRNSQPVLNLGDHGAWDEIAVSHVNVVMDASNGYHMFYYGGALKDYRDRAEMQRGAIGHATSSDGIHWIKDARNPLISYRTDKWDSWAVGGPTALFNGNKLMLWYFANQNSGLVSAIGVAGGTCR